MAALTAQGLGDLIAMTQRNLGRAQITEVATDVQNFTAAPQLINRNRVTFQGGTGVQWNVMVAHANSARNVGLNEPDLVTIENTTTQATADWRNTVVHYAFLGQEIAMNGGAEQILNLLKIRRISAMIGFVKLMEDNWWGPPVAASDDITPWGVNTWIVKNASQGFNGGNPSGYTKIGLDASAYPRWRNWTDIYTNPTRDDLVEKLKMASRYTDFTPPVNGIPSYNTGNAYGYYSNYPTVTALEGLLASQNDNLGNDIAPYINMTMFRRSPVQWVRRLDADTTNPVYGINFGVFKTAILQGYWMHEVNIPNYPGQHNMTVVFMDSTYQHICYDRRRNFVVATGTTYPS